MSVSSVFVLFRWLLWKTKLDLTALSKGFDSWSINVSFSTGSIASCGVMKTPSWIIRKNQKNKEQKNRKMPRTKSPRGFEPQLSDTC